MFVMQFKVSVIFLHLIQFHRACMGEGVYLYDQEGVCILPDYLNFLHTKFGLFLFEVESVEYLCKIFHKGGQIIWLHCKT